MKILSILKEKVMNLFNKKTAEKIAPAVQVSDLMANAITEWFKLFYKQHKDDKAADKRKINFAVVLTSYMATLATSEIKISAGTSKRGIYITDQMERFVLSSIRKNTQLAGAGGETILKPFVSGKNIFCEAVTADRFYPTRINCADIAEAGFFTDFDTLNGKTVVRFERFDLRPEGLYINNKAYYENIDGLGAEVKLTAVERWKDIPHDALIRGVDRPLFAQLKMPFANTIDNTSRLPVSLYANATEELEDFSKIYSDFLWEVKTAKRRKIIDETALVTKNGKEQNPNDDIATEEYIKLNMLGTHINIKPFDDYTPQMRIEEYQKAIDIQLRLIEMKCGFSTGTFNFDIKTGKFTATQIISDDKDTYNTIKTIQDFGMKQALKDLIYIYDVYATIYNLAPSGEIEPTVSFGDSIFEDTAVEFARRKQMVDSGLLKGEKFVAWYLEISEEEALKDYMPTAEDDNIFGDD